MAANGQHEIMAENDYDPTEAKFCACLFWLIFHATEDGDFGEIPSEITCPTERDPEERFLVRSNVASFLCKGTVYVKVCSQVFESEEIKSIWDVIQKLSKEGLYVIDTSDEAVTEERLSQNDEFDLDAHLAMMDTLMMAHVNKSVEIQQIVSAISSFASFNAAKELPFDLEDALLLWLNKVNTTNEKRLRKSRSPETSSAGTPGRFRFKREQTLARSQTLFPKLDDLQMDVANGKALLSLLLFYLPEALSHENIKSSEPMNQNDVICNIELFRELCAQHVCTSVFALRTEDFIFKAPELKNNLIALLTEMFVIIELEKSAIDIIVNNRDTIDSDEPVRNSELGKGARAVDEYRKELEAIAKENLDPNDLARNLHKRIDENHYDEKDTFRGDSPPSNYEKLRNFKFSGAAEQSEAFDDVDQSIQDKLQKLKTLSATKKEFAGKEITPLDNEKGYTGVEEAQWNPDTATKTDSLHKPGTMARSRQPLLSKRSKKQLKNLGNEERSFSQEDLSGVHLVDFDLKRSHSLTSVIGKSNYSVDPSKSFKAWGEEKSNEEPTKSKGQKISLDFKPDTTTYRRQTPTGTTDHVRTHPAKVEPGYHQTSDSSLADRNTLNQFAKKGYEPLYFADDTSKRLLKPHHGQSSSTNESLESNTSGELQNFRTEILERTRKVDNKEELTTEFEEPQFEDDDLFASGKFVSNITSRNTSGALGHGQSPRPNKLLGLESRQNATQPHTFMNEHLKDHDDDLSTIPETSEPSTPTVYSFQTDRSEDGSENSRTLGTDDGTQESCDDCQSPTVVNQDITPYNSMDDVELPAAIGSSASEYQFVLKSKHRKGPRDSMLQREGNSFGHLSKSSGVAPGLSYTVLSSDMSLEAAKAAGLPIIGNSSAYHDIDVNSFDSAVLDVKSTESTKSEKAMNTPEIGQENENHIVADMGRDSTSIKVTDELMSQHGNSISDSDRCENGLKLVGSQKASNLDTFQERLASGNVLEGGAPSQSVAMDVVNMKGIQDSSQMSRHHDLQWLGQSKEIREEPSLFHQLNSENEVSGGVLDALEDITKSFHPASDGKKPPHLEFKDEDPYLASRRRISKNALDEDESFDINHVSSIDDRDVNSTITWSEVQAEKKSVARNLKSPEKAKSPVLATVGDCPVINWAEYAKNREPDDDSHESEGRVFINLI